MEVRKVYDLWQCWVYEKEKKTWKNLCFGWAVEAFCCCSVDFFSPFVCSLINFLKWATAVCIEGNFYELLKGFSCSACLSLFWFGFYTFNDLFLSRHKLLLLLLWSWECGIFARWIDNFYFVFWVVTRQKKRLKSLKFQTCHTRVCLSQQQH